MTQTWRTRLLVGGLELLVAAVGRAPRVPVGERTCAVAGTLWYLASPGGRQAVRTNLRQVLGHSAPERMVREVFFHGALNYWDTLAAPSISRQEMIGLVHMSGLEHVDEARAAGRGVVLAGAHLSSIATVGTVMPAYGYPMTSLVELIDPPEVLDLFTRLRTGHGGRMLPATPAALRELLASLRRNEIVGLVSDRALTGIGPMVEFFGAPAQFPDGAAALAVRTGAPVLPAIAIRLPDGSFRGTIEPPIPRATTGDSRARVLEMTQSLARRLEYHIASHPEQWTVFQKRWPPLRPAGGGSEQ